jgi:protein-S-isoprenylcysteine O-methyltransferase Ste14
MDRARVIVPPLVTAYAIFVVMVVRAWRRPTARAPRTATTRDVVSTTVGGYLVFLAIVAVFHVALAGQRGALRSAVWSGAFLLFGAAAVSVAWLWTATRIGRVRSRREGGRADEGDGLENGHRHL